MTLTITGQSAPRAATPTDSTPGRRRSIRLPDWNYAAAAAYFVTLCARHRACLFGNVVRGVMVPNETGTIADRSWRWLGTYPHVTLDEWCVMPNHLHGILLIAYGAGGGSRAAPTDPSAGGMGKPLGGLIGAFKTRTTKEINRRRQTPGGIVWQRNYWEHIVRDECELELTRQYIRENPARWPDDSLFVPM